MVNEVIDRVNLMIMTQGGRRVSKENLGFLFDKYELNSEERQQVLDYCKESRIEVFTEMDDAAGPAESAADTTGSVPGSAESAADTTGFVPGPTRKADENNSGGRRKKGGFFSRLFGQ